MKNNHGRIPAAALLAILLLTGMAAASQQITIDNAEAAAGDTQTVSLVLDQATEGLSGYTITVQVDNPAVARIESWTPPSWADMSQNGTLPAASMTAQAVALSVTKLPSGSKNIPLGRAVIRGVSPGTTTLSVSLTNLDDNSGGDYIPSTTIAGGTITVTGSGISTGPTPIALPGQGRLPTSPGGDGHYEDLNGDDAVSFSDVSLYFGNFEWIQANEPITLFDYNKNGIIDFGDIVALNETI